MRFKEYLLEFADYIYKNKNDDIRVKVFKRTNGEWDLDVFFKNKPNDDFTFSTEMGDSFITKKESLKWINNKYGKMKINNKVKSVKDGW